MTGLPRHVTRTPPTFFPSIVTWNVRGLSNYRRDKAGVQRQLLLRKHLERLGRSYDVIFIQETHLLPNDPGSLSNSLPGWALHTSGKSSSSAGVLTAISPRTQALFKFTQARQPSICQGYATISVATHFSFALHNFYLPTGNNSHTHKSAILSAALELQPTQYTFTAGDFNFVEDLDDTSSAGAQYHIPDGFARTWRQYKTTYNLSELHQPSAT